MIFGGIHPYWDSLIAFDSGAPIGQQQYTDQEVAGEVRFCVNDQTTAPRRTRGANMRRNQPFSVRKDLWRFAGQSLHRLTPQRKGVVTDVPVGRRARTNGRLGLRRARSSRGQPLPKTATWRCSANCHGALVTSDGHPDHAADMLRPRAAGGEGGRIVPAGANDYPVDALEDFQDRRNRDGPSPEFDRTRVVGLHHVA